MIKVTQLHNFVCFIKLDQQTHKVSIFFPPRRLPLFSLDRKNAFPAHWKSGRRFSHVHVTLATSWRKTFQTISRSRILAEIGLEKVKVPSAITKKIYWQVILNRVCDQLGLYRVTYDRHEPMRIFLKGNKSINDTTDVYRKPQKSPFADLSSINLKRLLTIEDIARRLK